MPTKHIFGVALGIIGIGLLFAFVYLDDPSTPDTIPLPMTESPKTQVSERQQKAPVPETIDAISESIQDETAADLSALDEEEEGEVEDIETDSDSINNLGTSYDENSL